MVLPRMETAAPTLRAAVLALASSLALAACAPAAAPPAAVAGPAFAPEQWFQGRTEGRGEFRRVLGGTPGRFDMTIQGGWDGRVLTMHETFRSPHGRWDRVWTITKDAGGRYAGRVSTGQGPAEITAAGDTVRMRYRAEAPLVQGPFAARFEQTLRLRPNGTVLNTADVYKWGLRIGRSTVVFRKPEPT